MVAVTAIGGKPFGSVTLGYWWQDRLIVRNVVHPTKVRYVPRGVVVYLAEHQIVSCRCLFRWTIQARGGKHSMLAKPNASLKATHATRIFAAYIHVTGDISLIPPTPEDPDPATCIKRGAGDSSQGD
jgi:hypothetical protein